MSPRKQSGFTLIELLVVIAIIAILAAILFPVFAKARERATATQCLSNQKQLAQAFMMYADDKNEKLPPPWEGPPFVPKERERNWVTDVKPYLKSEDVRKCPLKPRFMWGVGFNVWAAWPTGMPLSKIKYPSKMCMFTETVEDVDRSAPEGWPTDKRFYFDVKRHRGGANMAFCDGHAQWVQSSNLTKWPKQNTANTTGYPPLVPGWGVPRGTYFWPTEAGP